MHTNTKVSVLIPVYNEEKNIRACIESCKGLTDEIVVVDGSSTDRTAKIAKEMGARVIKADNPRIFHINKQKAIDACQGEWILQLDADERVTPELAGEIRRVTGMDQSELREYQRNLPEMDLFLRHEKVGGIRHENDKTDHPIEAFFIPRLNYFLGTYLRHGGVYPDGVIRLFRKGKAHLPCHDVHELMKVDGRVGWLQYPLL